MTWGQPCGVYFGVRIMAAKGVCDRRVAMQHARDLIRYIPVLVERRRKVAR